jgi:hypothetical protein
MTHYQYIAVWRRESYGLKLYRCFGVLVGGGYVVQSADRFYAKHSRESVAQLERQFLELLLEEAPDERVEPRPSIEEAIRHFDSLFADESD